MHEPHDHHHDHSHAHNSPDAMLRAAEDTCHRNGTRLTTQRRLVLESLVEGKKPLGAYDLIEAMRQKTGRAPAPIAIYRALDFLKEQGFIHRLETLNAFIACPHHHDESEPVVFLICEECRSVSEATADPLASAIRSVAATQGFVAKRQVMELAGTCRACQSPVGAQP
jgi:Fur family transcriptional regulator, zinc uptake regulator